MSVSYTHLDVYKRQVKGPEKAQKRLRGEEIQSHVAYNAQEQFSRRPRFMVGKND